MGRVDLEPFWNIFVWSEISRTYIKSAFRYSTRLPPSTACAELDSGLIENVSDLHLLPGASPHPTYQKPS